MMMHLETILDVLDAHHESQASIEVNIEAIQPEIELMMKPRVPSKIRIVSSSFFVLNVCVRTVLSQKNNFFRGV